jgi:hypothetical protein
VVRHQPSKLIFVGSNPISRSQFGVPVSSVSVSHDAGALDTEILKKGPVAQRLAQATHNRLVAGSNPAGPTRHLIVLQIFAGHF